MRIVCLVFRLTNVAFELISVSLTEVIKSFVTVLVLLVGFCRRTEVFSWVRLLVMLSISAGVALTSLSEVGNLQLQNSIHFPHSLFLRTFLFH